MDATVNVAVTDASEGPWCFTVQKENDKALIIEVAELLQRAEKELVKFPIFLGQPCMAYCQPQAIYARYAYSDLLFLLINFNFQRLGRRSERQ